MQRVLSVKCDSISAVFIHQVIIPDIEISNETPDETHNYRRYVDNSSSIGIYGEYGDFFAGRITFPVYDMNGCIQGLICRRPDNRAKLRWVKQRAGHTGIHPAGWLYGINKAAEAIKRYKTIILVEGIFDFFAFYKLFQNKDMASSIAKSVFSCNHMLDNLFQLIFQPQP